MTKNCEVFISYSKDDKLQADAACVHLESFGIKCWIAPRDIHPSEDWAEAIINAMDNSKILLLIFSDKSNHSPQVRREVERAVNKGLSILPFRIEEVPLSKSMEYFISAQQWLDAFDGDMDKHLIQLGESVLRTLNHLSPVRSAAEPQSARPPAQPHTEVQVQPQAVLPTHAASTISPEVITALETFLAQTLGPIARHLVKRKNTDGISAKDLIAELSHEIENDQERKQFLSKTSSLHSH